MATIVCVHGIGQQLKGEETLRKDWLPAIRDGLARAGAALPEDASVGWAFYGDLFRLSGRKSVGVPPFTAADVSDPDELALLSAWWQSAAETDPAVPAPDVVTKAKTPQWVQRALNALSGSRFFAGASERLFIRDLKQVTSYFRDASIREETWNRFASVISPTTKVVIGHSLGSVVAYEALNAGRGGRSLPVFLTLGSPLGIRNVVFDRLIPPPQDGMGALTKELRPLFSSGRHKVQDDLVDNGATAHDVLPYLTSQESGRAILAGLTA
jgi:hypothetical protein